MVGPKGFLQGIIACGNYSKGIQSDRHRYGGAMYRERHSHECCTNGRSIMAKEVDQQLEVILALVELEPDWHARMVRLSMKDVEGPDPKELQERKRRLSRAYADGGFTDAEYQVKRDEIDASYPNSGGRRRLRKEGNLSARWWSECTWTWIAVESEQLFRSRDFAG